MDDAIKDRVRFATEIVFVAADLTRIDEIFSPAYVAHSGESKDGKGPAFVRRYITQLRAALPDLRLLELEFLVNDGERVTWRRTLAATHENKFLGIPPSGKGVQWQEMVVSRFDDGKIAEEWVVSELAGRLLSHAPRS